MRTPAGLSRALRPFHTLRVDSTHRANTCECHAWRRLDCGLDVWRCSTRAAESTALAVGWVRPPRVLHARPPFRADGDALHEARRRSQAFGGCATVASLVTTSPTASLTLSRHHTTACARPASRLG